MRKLNTSAGILEVMGAPLTGTELRAYVMSGGGITLKNFKPRLRSKRCFLIFPIRGSEKKGLVSVEIKKKKGQVWFHISCTLFVFLMWWCHLEQILCIRLVFWFCLSVLITKLGDCYLLNLCLLFVMKKGSGTSSCFFLWIICKSLFSFFCLNHTFIPGIY